MAGALWTAVIPGLSQKYFLVVFLWRRGRQKHTTDRIFG
jgi:hypothetical protein